MGYAFKAASTYVGVAVRRACTASLDPPLGRAAITPRLANRKLSSDALCLTVLCELYERKTTIFRPSKVPLLSILFIEVFAGPFCVGFLAHSLYLPVHTTNEESTIYGRSALSAPRCHAGCRAQWHRQILSVPPDSTYPLSR